MRETFSKNGVPTEEQAKAYLTMLGSTAGLKGDLPAAAIFDFSLDGSRSRLAERAAVKSGARPGENFSRFHQNQTGYADGIAKLFADLCGALRISINS